MGQRDSEEMAEQVTYAEVKFKDHPEERVSSAKDRGTASLDVPLPVESTLQQYCSLTRQPQQDGHQKAARCSCWVYATIILGILCLLLAILSIVLGILWPRLYCPKEWALWNATCYYKSTGNQDWASSFNDCIKRGAYLVTTYDNRWEFFRETPFWVGAVAKDQKDAWLTTKNVLSAVLTSNERHVWINNEWYKCGASKDAGAPGPSAQYCNENLPWICERAATLQRLDEGS